MLCTATVGRSDGGSDGRTVGRTDGRTVGRSDGRTDGRSDGHDLYVLLYGGWLFFLGEHKQHFLYIF